MREPTSPVGPISVLMSSYWKERPENLFEALLSVLDQTMKPAEIVLVFDGAVCKGQHAVVEHFQKHMAPTQLKVIELSENQGLASAMNIGLANCREDFIARMDSDDISAPDRFAKQLEIFSTTPDVDVVASWQGEFNDQVTTLHSIKKIPEGHTDICKKIRIRGIISHPSIMVRRSVIENVGGYSDRFGKLEDYLLHMDLIQNGAKYYAIQRPLILVRTSPGQRARRGGLDYLRNEWRFRHALLKRGQISVSDFVFTVTTLSVFRLMPSFLKGLAYRFVRETETNSDANQRLEQMTQQRLSVLPELIREQ